MKRLIRPAARGLLAVFAMAWPWDVYQYVPWIGVNLTGLAALGLVVLWVADAALYRRNRVPFELAWPGVALLVFLWISAFTERAAFPVVESMFIALFAAVCHFGPANDDAMRYLVYSAVSGTCVAVLSLFSCGGILVPTAYSLDTGATFAGAHDITGGFLALLVCLMCGRAFAWGVGKPWWRHAAAAVASGAMVAVLVVVAVRIPANLGLWRLPGYGQASIWTLVAYGVCVWLAARVMAKLVVARRVFERRKAPVFLLVCATLVAVALCVPLVPRSAYAFLFGLAAAYARAKQEREDTPALGRWCWAPVAFLVVLNIGQVYPENVHDPRNYEVAAAQDFRARNFGRLERRMAFWETRSAGESRTHLWRARVALERGLPDLACEEFAESLLKPNKEEPAPLLPRPTDGEQDDFLTRLRDYCSSLPKGNRVFAYERALVAAGRDDAAIAALRWRVTPPAGDTGSASSASLAERLARVLGSERLAEKLAAWPAGDLASILEQMPEEPNDVERPGVAIP